MSKGLVVRVLLLVLGISSSGNFTIGTRGRGLVIIIHMALGNVYGVHIAC